MKQVSMYFLIDNDVETRSTRSARSTQQPAPSTDVVATYLAQAGSRGFALGSGRRPEPQPASAQDLWDYLGDFA
jgi:hypothetical protein